MLSRRWVAAASSRFGVGPDAVGLELRLGHQRLGVRGRLLELLARPRRRFLLRLL